MKMTRIARKMQILKEYIKLAKKYGYHKITRDMIAARLNISRSLINYHFVSVARMQKEMLLLALEKKETEIIKQAEALKNTFILQDKLRRVKGKVKLV